MPLDLQSLSTDTLLYMLMHSGVFVVVTGLVFFIIGLLFGRAIWGRYKRLTRIQTGEIQSQREEIATLKRKLGEQSVKSGGAPMVTEVIPTLPPAGAAASADSPPKVKLPKSKNVIKLKSADDTVPSGSRVSAGEPVSSPLAAIIAPPPPAAKKAAASAPEAAASGTGLGAAELGIATLPEVPAAPMPPPRIKPENDPKLGLVFKTPPPAEMRDDLTALKGIAKVLENRLHEFGIYTWEQIATWSPEHVKEFSARLAFKDRIQREDWIGQAQKLHAEKSAAKA